MQYARQKSIGGLRMSSVFHLYTTLPSTVSLMSGELPMQEKRGLLSPATKALPKPGYKMSIAHANAQALCPLFSCILCKAGRFSLPVHNSKTLLYAFVSRYHTTCYHKDRQYFQILAAVTAIISTGLMSNPGARFSRTGKSCYPAICRCTLTQCELRRFRFWIILTVAAGPVQYQPFISNQHYEK